MIRLLLRLCLSASLPASIVYVTVTDGTLGNYTVHVLLLSALLFVTGCMFTLSSASFFRMKETAFGVPADLLSESDIESEEETERVQQVQRFIILRMISNFIRFGDIHATYKIISFLGTASLIASLMFAMLSEWLKIDSQSKEDFLYSAAYLFITGIVILSTIFILSNMKDAYKEDKRSFNYKAFDEYVQVPTRMIAGKAFAAFLTGGYRYILQFLLGLVIFLYGTYGICCSLEMTEDDIRKWQQISKSDSIRTILFAILTIAIYCGIRLMVKVIMNVFNKAKRSLLITMEENWQRNINACEYLFPVETVNSLSTLKHLLQEKSVTDWTEEEKFALEYISLPLWKPKRAFIKKRS